MKFLKTALIFFIFFFTVRVGNVNAQNETREVFSKVFSDYQQKYQEYLLVHDQYTLSKKEYEKYLTLSSKEKLQEDTSYMLIKRDEVLITYYRSILAKMDDSLVKMPEDRKSEYIQKYNDEITWLNEHKNLYQINDSPQTLSLKSEEVDQRFQKFKGEIYKSLYYISRGKIQTYSERYDGLYNDLFALTEKIKVEQREAYKLSDSKLEIIYRWFGEINLKDEAYTNLLNKADDSIFKSTDKTVISVYNTAMKTLSSAMNLFKERISFAKEVVNEIKVSEN
jgi:hypothetical protein